MTIVAVVVIGQNRGRSIRPRVVLQHGVGNVAVRNELNRAVVVAQLLFGQHVRTVTVHAAVDTTISFTTLVIVPMSCDTMTIAMRVFSSCSVR